MEMQPTRKSILEILRSQGEATVEEIVTALRQRMQHTITAVTVRHHLDILREEDLLSPPVLRRSGAPGRPQYVYKLTEKALSTFPNNYQNIMAALLEQLKTQLGSPHVNVILEGVADQMVTNSRLAHLAGVPLPERLNHVVTYLNEQGYEATWERCPEGYLLKTQNCPYHQLSSAQSDLCVMDMRLISGLVGVVPRSMGRIADDAESCVYLIPA
ncbi:MAG TPA: ArsR family transcriptional regulator [Aggregatilineales bacterium]|nr:ArsR family transcriptional regulator [Anaerolineales bacterium]HRE48686.1 ArsR family transcriptional regulator [Aggregatilineales bacterium]